MAARFVLFAIFAAFALGCGERESRVQQGNRLGIYHLGNNGEPQSLDPHLSTGIPEARISAALFEGLVSKNPRTLAPEPGAAERWEISADGLTYRFYLRADARWSNGDALWAEDFRWSWWRALQPALANPYAYMLYPVKNARAYVAGDLKNFSEVGVRVIEPLVLEVVLAHPTPYFLQLLDHHSTYAVHRPTLERHGAPDARRTAWTEPGSLVGNGPFVLKQWVINRHVLVEKNPHYWDRDKVALNGIYFYPTDHQAAEERMFRAGQLHQTYTLPTEKIPVYRRENPRALRLQPYLGTYYYQLNLTRRQFADARVRRALAMSIDREQLVAAVLKGAATPAYAITPPGTLGYQPPKTFAFDPAAARELLAVAGFPAGEGFPATTILTNQGERHRDIAVAIQQMWRQHLNIEVGIRKREWKVYLSERANLQHDIAAAGWIGDYVDPLNFLDLWLSDSGNNHSGWADAHYDKMLRRAAVAGVNSAQRLPLYYEAEQYLLGAMPFIPLYTYQSKYLVDPGVRGVTPNLMDYLNFKYISLRKNFPVEMD